MVHGRSRQTCFTGDSDGRSVRDARGFPGRPSSKKKHHFIGDTPWQPLAAPPLPPRTSFQARSFTRNPATASPICWSTCSISTTGPIPKAGLAGNRRGLRPALARAGDIATLYKIGRPHRLGHHRRLGEFVFEVTTKDFNLPRKTEQKPDLVLLVLAPDEPGLDLNKRLLHFAQGHPPQRRQQRGLHHPAADRLAEGEGDSRRRAQPRRARRRRRSKVSLYVSENEARERVQRRRGRLSWRAGRARDRRSARCSARTSSRRSPRISSAVPLSGVLVADGDNIEEKNTETVASGIAKANAALGDTNAQGVPVNLYLTPADKTRLQPYFDNASGGFVEIPDDEVQDILFRDQQLREPRHAARSQQSHRELLRCRRALT